MGIKAVFQKIKNRIALRGKKPKFVFLRKPVYCGRHPGKDFLIIATGPSLKDHKEPLARFIAQKGDGLITMGCNFLDNMFVTQYLIFANRRRFCTYSQTVPPESVILVSPALAGWIIKKFIGRRYYERAMYKNEYFTKTGDIRIDSRGIIYTQGGTLATVALGVAVVMGAKNIYFAGLDGFSMYQPEHIHYFKDDDSIPFDRRLMQEKATHYMLDQMNEVLATRGGAIRILTPTVYKKYHAPEILAGGGVKS